jgi:hypothetical protein
MIKKILFLFFIYTTTTLVLAQNIVELSCRWQSNDGKLGNEDYKISINADRKNGYLIDTNERQVDRLTLEYKDVEAYKFKTSPFAGRRDSGGISFRKDFILVFRADYRVTIQTSISIDSAEAAKIMGQPQRSTRLDGYKCEPGKYDIAGLVKDIQSEIRSKSEADKANERIRRKDLQDKAKF